MKSRWILVFLLILGVVLVIVVTFGQALHSQLTETTILLIQSGPDQAIAWRSGNSSIRIDGSGHQLKDRGFLLPDGSRVPGLPTTSDNLSLLFTGSSEAPLIAAPRVGHGPSYIWFNSMWNKEEKNVIGAFYSRGRCFVVTNNIIYPIGNKDELVAARLNPPIDGTSSFYWSSSRHLFAIVDSRQLKVYNESGSLVELQNTGSEILGIAEVKGRFAVITNSDEVVTDNGSTRKVQARKEDSSYEILACPTADGMSVVYSGQFGQFWVRRIR